MSHYYDLEGKPQHFQVTASGKNKGKKRPSTVRDARKLKLFPSVTEIISLADKSGLTVWKIRQALTAFCNADFEDMGITNDSDKIKHCVGAMEAIGKKAADRGTEIHNYIEMFIDWCNTQDGPYETGPHDAGYITVFQEALGEIGVELEDLIAEQSFVILDYGYGGSVDINSRNSSNPIIIDIKTKDTVGKKKDPEGNDDYCMQLTAYRMGLGLPIGTRLINLFLSRDEIKASWVEYTLEESMRSWKMFCSLNEFWRAKNKYDPTR